MGAIDGADFGNEFAFNGDEAGDEWGDDYGADDYGDDYGADDYGYTPAFNGPSPSAAMAHRRTLPVRIARPIAPPPSVAAKLWAHQRRSQNVTHRRRALLEPNLGSKISVQRYSFSINAALVFGVASNLFASGQPDTNIRPQRVTMNAPSPGFVTINEIKVANVSVTVGGIGDAFEYSPIGVGMTLDMPTLSPANRASVQGAYTGFVPPGFVGGAAFAFVTSFKGPASIVA
jgi:hypothetical protein